MRTTFKFWRKCAQEAFAHSAAFANDWQWVLGIPIVLGFLNWSRGGTVMIPNHHIWDSVAVAGSAFAVTLLFSFIFRVWGVAAHLHASECQKVTDLQAKADIATATRDQTAAIREQTEELKRANAQSHPAQNLSTSTDGIISARDAIIPVGPNGLKARAESGGKIILDGSVGTVTQSPNWQAVFSPNELIGLQEAAQIAYESAEQNGWLDIVTGSTSDPEDRLTTFKYMISLQAQEGAVALSGIAPPSTKSYPIPKVNMRHLHPGKGESTLRTMTPNKVAYHGVTISRADLEKVIQTYHLHAREHDDSVGNKVGEFLALNTASEIIWKAIQGTEFAEKMEQDLRTPTKILDQLSNRIVGRGLAWGVKWPDTERTQIGKTNLYYVMPDGVSLAYHAQSEAIIRDVAVKPSDMDEFIRYAKNVSVRI